MKKLERKLKTSRETSQKLIQGKKAKMKRQEKINKEENGITLIALVITIVILIILATITIDFAFGEDGLIKRAMQAKNLTEEATRKEQESLNSLLDEYDDIIGGGGSTPEEPDDEIKGTITFDDYEWQGDGTASVVVRTEETEYTLQYQIVGAEETIEENEWIDIKSGETITGLKYGDTVYARLTDGTNESKEYANVTIEDNIAPQGTTISLSGTSTDTEGSVTATVTLKDNESGVNVTGSKWVINSSSGNIVHEGTQGQNATAYELEKWVNSVKNNGGYYIGRYEASYASGASSEMDFAVDYSKCKAASKVSTSYQASFYMTYKVGALWNCITQIDASKVSINTYKNSSNGVRSDLINSYAWDTALMYVHEAGNTNYADKEVEGNNITNTGVSGDEVCKINDLAANISEWTTEYCSMYNGTDNFCCTHRGAGVTSGHRSQSYTETAFPSIGFRLTLYLV